MRSTFSIKKKNMTNWKRDGDGYEQHVCIYNWARLNMYSSPKTWCFCCCNIIVLVPSMCDKSSFLQVNNVGWTFLMYSLSLVRLISAHILHGSVFLHLIHSCTLYVKLAHSPHCTAQSHHMRFLYKSRHNNNNTIITTTNLSSFPCRHREKFTHLSFNWSSLADGNGCTTKCKDDDDIIFLVTWFQ